MAFAVSTNLSAAQMAATLTLLSTGSGDAKIELYTSNRPASPNNPAGASAQVVIELDSPPGTISSGVLTLHPKNPTGDAVLSTGVPKWGRLYNQNGDALADGDVTDSSHNGDIRIIGGTTAPGATSPNLTVGGLVLLGTVALT